MDLMEDDVYHQNAYTDCELIISEIEAKLNQEQRLVYNTILTSVNNEEEKLFFKDGPSRNVQLLLLIYSW